MKKITSQEKIIHDQFVQYGRNAKEWMRKCVLLLPHIERGRIWEKKGFGSIYEYAAKLAGMSHPQVDDALWVLKKINDKPALQKVVEEKGLNSVRPIVNITTKETEKFWAEKAQQMSYHTLQTYVKEFRGAQRKETNSEFGKRPENDLQQTEISNLKFEDSSEKPQKLIAMYIDPEVAQELEKLKGQVDWNELMKQLLKIREEHLEEQKPEAVETDSRHIPNKMKKYVKARTNGQCAYPGCTKPAEIFQHTQRWALENIHDPDRLYGLCKEHDAIAHLGLIDNEESSPQTWKIRTQPDENHPKYDIDLVVQKFRSKHFT